MIYYLGLFILLCCIYLYVSIREKSIYNILFFDMYAIVGLMVFLNIVRLYFKKKYFDLSLGDILLIIYFIFLFISNSIIVLKIKPIKFIEFSRFKIQKRYLLIIITIVISYFIFQPELLRIMFTNPRMFYASTRIGGGMTYYIILPLLLFLFEYFLSQVSKKRDILILILIFIPVLFLFGQKTVFMKIAIFIVTLYYYKNCNNKRINKNIIILGILSSFALITSYYFYSLQQSIKLNVSDVFKGMAYYSDYLDNFNKLIEHLKEHTYGSLLFEKEFYSRVPRILSPNKPKIFGDIRLATFIPEYKEWVNQFTGAPSCGPLGLLYADFGPVISIMVNIITSGILLLIAKGYHKSMKKTGYNFFSHSMLLTLVGNGVFYSPSDIFPIEGVMCIWFIHKFLAKKEEGLNSEKIVN